MKKIKNYLAFTVLLFAITSCGNNELIGQANIVIDQAEENFDNIASIVVKGSFCNVDIQSHGADNVTFRGEVKCNRQRDDIKVKYEQKGSVLEVWLERPNSLKGSFKGLLEFKVPENTNVDVDNSSGSVYVSNIGQSVVQLKASSGSVEAKNIDSNLSVKTSSGSIKVSSINGNLGCVSSSGSQQISMVRGDVISKLSSGRISVEDVKGNLTSVSSSGSQQIKMIVGALKCTASSGSIKLSDVKGSLILNTSSGSQYGENISLTANSSFGSSSGSIKIGLTNAAEELSFKLSASSGSLSAMGISGSKKLEVTKGEILIVGKSSSGSQRYY